MDYHIRPSNIPWKPNSDDTQKIYKKANESPFAKPEQYRPSIIYLNLPISKYQDAQAVIEACDSTKNNAKRSIILGSMDDSIRTNITEMEKIILKFPDAIVHADRSILTQEFVKPLLIKNPEIYGLLPKELQADKEIVNAYAEGVINCGYRFAEEYGYDGFKKPYEDAEPSLELPVYKHEIDKHCDLRQFYSPENYRKAYEQILLHGNSTSVYPNPGYQDMSPWQRYNPALAFLSEAHRHFGEDEKMLAMYKMAAAEAVVNCIDKITHRIATSYYLTQNTDAVQIMANALEVFEHPPAILGIEPQSEMVNFLTEKTKEAERMFYVDKGQELRDQIARLPENYPEITAFRFGIERLDQLMEMSESHPEMGIDDETRSKWWTQRGICLQNTEIKHDQALEANNGRWSNFSEDVTYLRRMASRHEEMRIGEQLVIDGFNAPEITDR